MTVGMFVGIYLTVLKNISKVGFDDDNNALFILKQTENMVLTFS